MKEIFKDLMEVPYYARTPLYASQMGSVAYGVSSDDSDIDIYALCIPPKKIIFPHLDGVIRGFGRQGEVFKQQQVHGYKDKYDINIYSIIQYFSLLMENNPNVIDSIFTPQNCIIICSHVGQIIRDNRKIFLHKGAFHKFSGYAHKQITNLKNKKYEGKRLEVVEKFGWDTKAQYHTVRLIDEIEQILETGDLILGRNAPYLKSIRAGHVTPEESFDYFYRKKKYLDTFYETSELEYSPDEEKIKKLLLNCLEHNYGSIDKSDIVINESRLLEDLKILIEKYNTKGGRGYTNGVLSRFFNNIYSTGRKYF